MKTRMNNLDRIDDRKPVRRFLRLLVGAAVLATTGMAGQAEAQVRLNSSITDANHVMGLVDDNTLLFDRNINFSGTWMCDEPLAPGWGIKKVNAYGPGYGCVYDAPRTRFVAPVGGGTQISTLTLNPANGTWNFMKYSVNLNVALSAKVTVDPATGDIFVRDQFTRYIYVCNLEKGQWGAVVSTVAGGNPVYDRNDPERSLYFRGTDNRLYRTYYAASKWQTQQISSALLGGDPVVNTKKSVIFRDSANRIASTWLDGNQFWNTAPWTQANNVTGDPVVGTSSGEVFYRGNDGNLFRCSWTGYGFTTQKLTSTANVKYYYGGIAELFVNSKDQVFYCGTDNSLWRY